MYYANILSERLKASDHQQKRGSKIASERGETPERACEKQVDDTNERKRRVSLTIYDH